MPQIKSQRNTGFLAPIIILLIIIALWSVVAWSKIWLPSIIPSPLTVLESFFREVRNGRIFEDLVASLFRVTCGFAAAAVTGIPLGLWLGSHRRAQEAILPFINFFRNLSPLAWIPFAILWFGIGDLPAVFLIFITAFFPLVLATVAAVANIPAIYFRVAQDYRMSATETLLEITLPAVLPQLITALRVTAGVSWMVVVAAEMIAGRDGLGYAVWDARNGLRIDLLIVQMLVIGALGVLIDRILMYLTLNPRVSWSYEK